MDSRPSVNTQELGAPMSAGPQLHAPPAVEPVLVEDTPRGRGGAIVLEA